MPTGHCEATADVESALALQPDRRSHLDCVVIRDTVYQRGRRNNFAVSVNEPMLLPAGDVQRLCSRQDMLERNMTRFDCAKLAPCAQHAISEFAFLFLRTNYVNAREETVWDQHMALITEPRDFTR